MPTASPLAPAGGEVLDKARALELIGREDLAYLELVFAAQFRRAAEGDLAVAEALADDLRRVGREVNVEHRDVGRGP